MVRPSGTSSNGALTQALPRQHAISLRYRRAVERPGTEVVEERRAGFVTFLLLTAVVFIRPAEIVPALLGLPLYELLITGSLLLSLPGILGRLRLESLRQQPGVACVVGLLPAVALSHLSHGDFWSARFGALNFFKVLAYYLLLITVVSSPRRLRIYLQTVAILILISAVLALARYYGVIELPGMGALTDHRGVDADTGEVITVLRLQASGVFSDPNDFSLILGAAIFITVHLAMASRRWLVKLACIVPIGTYGFALALTHSRGGFLALMAGAASFIIGRWGTRRAIPVAIIVLPVMLALFAGRQTDIDLGDEEDTAHGRIELWREGVALFKSAPVFGIGQGLFADEAGLVAHNSYIHCYAEMGVVGGTLFVGAMFIPMFVLWRKSVFDAPRVDPELRALRPALAAILTAYAVGLFSLSRNYSVTTYVILGMAGVFCVLARQRVPGAVPSFSAALVGRVLAAGVGCLGMVYVMIKVFG